MANLANFEIGRRSIDVKPSKSGSMRLPPQALEMELLFANEASIHPTLSNSAKANTGGRRTNLSVESDKDLALTTKLLPGISDPRSETPRTRTCSSMSPRPPTLDALLGEFPGFQNTMDKAEAEGIDLFAQLDHGLIATPKYTGMVTRLEDSKRIETCLPRDYFQKPSWNSSTSPKARAETEDLRSLETMARETRTGAMEDYLRGKATLHLPGLSATLPAGGSRPITPKSPFGLSLSARSPSSVATRRSPGLALPTPSPSSKTPRSGGRPPAQTA